MELMLYQEITD